MILLDERALIPPELQTKVLELPYAAHHGLPRIISKILTSTAQSLW